MAVDIEVELGDMCNGARVDWAPVDDLKVSGAGKAMKREIMLMTECFINKGKASSATIDESDSTDWW